MDIKNPIVPWLRNGSGATPSDGGCVMQVIDWLSSDGWTDRPKCVHPYLRHLAIMANDALVDGERQKLVDLIPRLMNTASNDNELTRQLGLSAMEYVLPAFVGSRGEWKVKQRITNTKARYSYGRAQVDEDPPFVRLSVVVVQSTDDDIGESVGIDIARCGHITSLSLLLHVLDAYDKFVGLRTFATPNYAEVCALSPGMSKSHATL
jgi:hypothetical protein